MRLRLGLVAATALLAAALAAPVPASGAEKGLNTDLTWGITDAEQTKEAGIVADSGARWVRMEMSWAALETAPLVYDQARWSHYDRAVELARGAGAKILVVVGQSPTWASGSTNRYTPPLDPSLYARFMGVLAARYAGKVAAYEIWNEQNHPSFWSTGPDPARYAALLKAAAPAVRAADPGAKVVFGGLARNDYAYLEAVYAADPQIGQHYDAMASHPYTANGLEPEALWHDASGRISKDAFAGYRELRKTMLARGDDKPIWLTEFGWATLTKPHPSLGGVNEATQADYTKRALKSLEADSYVQVALVYSLRNSWWEVPEIDNWEDQLGLMHVDFSPKPAYQAFKDYVPPSPAGPAPAETAGSAAPAAAAQPAAPSMKATSVRLSLRTIAVKARSAQQGAVRRRVKLSGRVVNATRGRVLLRLERRAGGRWRSAGRRGLALSTSGRFKATLTPRKAGKWRLRAQFTGASGAQPSISRFAYFSVR